MMGNMSRKWVGLLERLEHYGHHVSLVMCIMGFVFDSLFLPSIVHVFTQIICVLYFGIAGFAILISQAIVSSKIRMTWMIKIAPIFPVISQFVFGGLLSVVFVYYFRSAALSVSWPLVILLGSLMAGNELWKKHFARLEFQVTVLFLLFLFFSIFAVPLVFGEISTKIFLISVAFSISIMGIFIVLLSGVAWGALKERAIRLFAMLSSAALLIVVLYFTNIFPPIPLVVRADGVYHSLVRNAAGEYIGGKEEKTWKQRFFSFWYPPEYHRTQGEPLYFYSAVYAPTQLRTPVVHVWQYRDELRGEWVTTSRVQFPMSGGREAGYRGYSEKTYAPAGLWRVLVETGDGRTISRRSFVVIDADAPAMTTRTVI